MGAQHVGFCELHGVPERVICWIKNDSGVSWQRFFGILTNVGLSSKVDDGVDLFLFQNVVYQVRRKNITLDIWVRLSLKSHLTITLTNL